MSIQAVGWVLEHSATDNAVDRMVLVSLANHHNAGTGQCNPGQRRIAHEAACSQSSVARAIARLVELGEVVVVNTGAGTRTTDYFLPWLSTVLSPRAPQPDIRAMTPPRPPASDPQRVTSGSASDSSGASSDSSGASSEPPRRVETYNRKSEPRSADPARVRASMDAARAALGRPRPAGRDDPTDPELST